MNNPNSAHRALALLLPQLAEALKRAGEDTGPVATALPLTLAHPVPGLTAQTAAAALTTMHYEANEGLIRELLTSARGGEDAQARAYDGRELWELLQNAEDAYRDVGQSGEVRLHAERRDGRTWVVFCHHGKPFDAEDLDSFRSMHHSRKQHRARRLGRFGIGIKSLLAVADRLELHSGGFHLAFSEKLKRVPLFLLPDPAESRDDAGGVVLCLRWRDERITPEEVSPVTLCDVRRPRPDHGIRWQGGILRQVWRFPEDPSLKPPRKLHPGPSRIPRFRPLGHALRWALPDRRGLGLESKESWLPALRRCSGSCVVPPQAPRARSPGGDVPPSRPLLPGLPTAGAAAVGALQRAHGVLGGDPADLRRGPAAADRGLGGGRAARAVRHVEGDADALAG